MHIYLWCSKSSRPAGLNIIVWRPLAGVPPLVEGAPFGLLNPRRLEFSDLRA